LSCEYSSKVQQLVSASCLEVAAARHGGGRAGIGINLHRDRLIGMPKDSHDHARMYIQVDEQGRTCVPRIMDCVIGRTPAASQRAVNFLLSVRGSIGVP